MKKLILCLSVIGLISACNNTTKEAVVEEEIATIENTLEYKSFGDSITMDNAVDASKILAMLDGQDSLNIKVKGTINSSCKMKGCWMKMDITDDQEMHVSFKDYSFFVPKNLDGEEAIIDGYVRMETYDVDYLKHLAQDAGKSQEEIDAISEPETKLSYVATGVLIKS